MLLFSLTTLCTFLCLATAGRHNAKKCAKSSMKDCAKAYKSAVKRGDDHCKRLQVMITCLATNDPNCVGTVITSFRFWMLQMGFMDVKMKKCPDLETAKLKAIVTASIPKDKSVTYADSLESDSADMPCARESHDYCVHKYIKDFKTKKNRLCAAIDNLNACYNAAAKTCDAKILKDFAKILNKVATRVTENLKASKSKICGDVDSDHD